MATRTSHSSPCFLRVAAASAASSASKMISLSTPFSLETASTTIRISLFIVRTPAGPVCSGLLVSCPYNLNGGLNAQSKSIYQYALQVRLDPCPMDSVDGQAQRAALDFQGNLLPCHLCQPSGKALAAIDRSGRFQTHPLTVEARKMLR